jgi:hypothetical protein
MIQHPARSLLLVLLLSGVAALILVEPAVTGARLAAQDKDKKDGPPKQDLNLLALDILAFQTLDNFEFTEAQLRQLAKLAKETVQKPTPRKPGKASAALRKVMVELRAALVPNDDADKVDKLTTTYYDLRDRENPQLDDYVEITDAARGRAVEFQKKLTVTQVTAYAAVYRDTLQDPVERLLETMDKAHEARDADWKDLRDSVADEVGWLVAGLYKARAEKITAGAAALLDRARKLKEDEYKKQRPELEKAARTLVGEIPPTDILRHSMEHSLAELLSNPQLPVVLEARLNRKR